MFYDAPFTLFILLINVMVSGYALYFDTQLVNKLSFRPHRVLNDGEWYRLITGGFVHGGLGHLFLNMIALFSFGPWIEARLGSVLFLVIYFGSELSAHGVTLLKHRNSPSYSAVGASGAIAGVVMGYVLFSPLGRISIFPIPIGFPAWFLSLAFIVFSTYAMMKKDKGRLGGIAHEAHLGGALGGLLLTIILEPSSLSIFFNQMGW